MKVSELIEALAKMPQDCEVFTEGCDCNGEADRVALDGKIVMIHRPRPAPVDSGAEVEKLLARMREHGRG
jgi:hypothetical protein